MRVAVFKKTEYSSGEIYSLSKKHAFVVNFHPMYPY